MQIAVTLVRLIFIVLLQEGRRKSVRKMKLFIRPHLLYRVGIMLVFVYEVCKTVYSFFRNLMGQHFWTYNLVQNC